MDGGVRRQVVWEQLVRLESCTPPNHKTLGSRRTLYARFIAAAAQRKTHDATWC